MGFEKVNVESLNENFVKDIGSEWMLITAGNSDKLNTMTASWGFTGVMWGKPCAIAAIRPQRYTMEFIEQNEYSTFYSNTLVSKSSTLCSNGSKLIIPLSIPPFSKIFFAFPGNTQHIPVITIIHPITNKNGILL